MIEEKIKDYMLITCSTCKHYGKCCTTPFCLSITNYFYKHKKYPFLIRRYSNFKYLNWEPKKVIDFFLNDKDFEL
jgi:hypothetical protein